MRRFVFATVLAAGVALAAGTQARELEFGHVGTPGSLFDLSANHFADLASQRLEAAGLSDWKVVVFGASQLGNDREPLQKLELGTADFALPSTVMSSVADEFGLFEMPYLVEDRAHMKRIEEEIFREKLAPAAEAKGYRILAVWENGFRHITDNVRPIVVPEDPKGIKLGTPRGKWRLRMFELYGADPTPMAFSEVFVALQTGVIDGQENPFAQIWSTKFHEVQKDLSLTGLVYTPAYVTVGAGPRSKLPEEVRTILEQAAKDTQPFVCETAARLDEERLGRLADAGMEVNEADKDAFIDASGPVYDEFSAGVPGAKEMIERAVALGREG